MAKVLSISFHGKKNVVKANNRSGDGSSLAYFTLARAFSKFSY